MEMILIPESTLSRHSASIDQWRVEGTAGTGIVDGAPAWEKPGRRVREWRRKKRTRH